MTTVTEAVLRRSSIRAFLPDPVPKDMLVALLRKARRAPSGGNLQPWQVHAVTGAPLGALKAVVAERLKLGLRSEAPEYRVYPENLWEPHDTYRFQCGEDMYSTLGLERTDRTGRRAQFYRNFEFFGAPVGLFFTIDRRMGAPQWADTGMFMQTVMLLAVEAGLDTCAQECWSVLPATIGAFLDLPSEQMLFCGMALGFRDPEAPINATHTRRAELDTFTAFHGF